MIYYLLGFGYVWIDGDEDSLPSRFFSALLWPLLAGFMIGLYIIGIVCDVAIFLHTRDKAKQWENET